MPVKSLLRFDRDKASGQDARQSYRNRNADGMSVMLSPDYDGAC